MKIDVTVTNSSINFVNQCIDLPSNGIYLVTGANGVGKTTIFKHIVFSKRFEDHNRNHFSYAEQDPEKYDISIEKYLYRFNQNADVKMLGKLLEQFDLQSLNLKDAIMNVSGGELAKLNLISSLCKDTTFVFLDEPTNNMDNASVEKLQTILNELSKEKAIVVISHDPRLKFDKSSYIKIEKNTISVDYKSDEMTSKLDETQTKPISYPWFKLLTRHLFSKISIMNMVLLIIYAFLFCFFNHVFFSMFYDSEEITARNGTVLIYSVDQEYGEIGQLFSKCEKIEVDEDLYYSMIRYDSIPDIVEKYNVQNLYIENEIVSCALSEAVWSNSDSTEPFVFSVPEAVLNYANQINPIYTVEYLAEGRFPQDNGGELVTSQKIIDEWFPGKNIGDDVVFDGVTYKLTGIHYKDVIITSYTEDNDGLFYRYSPNSYDSFVKSQEQYKKEIDAPTENVYIPLTLVFQTEIKQEKTLLLDLFRQYPANNYRSYSYDKDLSDYNNNKLFVTMIVCNAVFGLCMGGSFILMNRRRRGLDRAEAISIDNYYLTKSFTIKFYGIVENILNVLLWLIFLSLAYVFSNYKTEFLIMSFGYTILCIIASLPNIFNGLKND